jgi:hypothetical protein
MFGNVFIALAAGIGTAIWVYRKTSYRGTGDFKKEIAPALFSGILAFLIMLTVLWTFVN